MGTMQGENGSVVVFDGEVRLNPQQKQRFLSSLIIIPGGCVIWAIWIMLLLEMMMKVEKQSSAIMILMIALFSVIPIMWLGNRLQRKILHRRAFRPPMRQNSVRRLRFEMKFCLGADYVYRAC